MQVSEVADYKGTDEQLGPVGLFIDGDHIASSQLAEILAHIQPLGPLATGRVYGNLSKHSPTLASWSEELLAQHQLAADFSSEFGKNTTAIRMMLDIIGDRPDLAVYVLAVASPDFSLLAQKLRRRGKRVIGLGRDNLPEAVKSAYDRYFPLTELRRENKLYSEQVQLICQTLAELSTAAQPWVPQERFCAALEAQGLDYQRLGFLRFHYLLWALNEQIECREIDQRWHCRLREPASRPGARETKEFDGAARQLVIDRAQYLQKANKGWFPQSLLKNQLELEGFNYQDYGFDSFYRLLQAMHGAIAIRKNHHTGIFECLYKPSILTVELIVLIERSINEQAERNPEKVIFSKQLADLLYANNVDFRSFGFDRLDSLIQRCPNVISFYFNGDRSRKCYRLKEPAKRVPLSQETLVDRQLHEKVQQLVYSLRRPDGYTFVSNMGFALKNVGIDYRQYCHNSLKDFLASIPGLTLDEHSIRVKLDLPPAELREVERGAYSLRPRPLKTGVHRLVVGQQKDLIQRGLAQVLEREHRDSASAAEIFHAVRQLDPLFKLEDLGYSSFSDLLRATGGLRELEPDVWTLYRRPAPQPSPPRELQQLALDSLAHLNQSLEWVSSQELLKEMAQRQPGFTLEEYDLDSVRDLLRRCPQVQWDTMLSGEAIMRLIPLDRALACVAKAVKAADDGSGAAPISAVENYLATGGFDYDDYGFDSVEDLFLALGNAVEIKGGRLRLANG